MGWSGLLSPHALMAAVGWIVAGGMAIPHIHIDERHRVRSAVPAAICCLGLVVTLIAGVVEQQRMRSADQQQELIADGVAHIARALKTPTTAPDRVLTAAATALQQQTQELQRQTLELAELRQQIGRLERLPPNPDVLYKGDVPMAVIAVPTIDAAARHILFKTVTAHADLDMTTPFLFRGWQLRCTATAHAGLIAGTAVDHITYWDLPCTIAR